MSGRLKDLIIIRGRNYYPDDIESAVYQGRPALRPGGAAAFTLHADGDDTKLIVVAEVQRTVSASPRDAQPSNALLAEVRAQIADLFGLRLAQLVLIRPGSIPKTSSGKLRRRHCRELLLADQLDRAEIHQPEAASRRARGAGDRTGGGVMRATTSKAPSSAKSPAFSGARRRSRSLRAR